MFFSKNEIFLDSDLLPSGDFSKRFILSNLGFFSDVLPIDVWFIEVLSTVDRPETLIVLLILDSLVF